MPLFAVTIEVRETPDDTLPDIGTEIVSYESLEVANRRARAIAVIQNADFEARGLTQRGRVVSVEPVEESPPPSVRIRDSLFL